MYTKLKNILNRMVSFERRRGDYFELGEIFDLIFKQIPYIRLKKIVNDIKQWELNSLKLANGNVAYDLLLLEYIKKAEILIEKLSAREVLYPVNIICQLINFLHLYQNKKTLFKTKLKVSLEQDRNYSICKIYTNINSSDHWFKIRNDEVVWSMVRQYTSAINLHSPFVAIERLNYNGKCLILVKFDLFKYSEEEKNILDNFSKKIGVGNITAFKKNNNHVFYGYAGNNFIKIVDSRIMALKKNSLYSECIFLNRLKYLCGFPIVKEYLKIGCYEMIITNNITGITFDEYLSVNNDIETILLFKIFDQVRKLRQNYIVHRDLRGSNIIISPSGELFIIDFDQAIMNMDSHNQGNLKWNYFSLSSPCVTLSDTLNKIPKVKNKIKNIQTRLCKVWQEAAKSNSNSPGLETAYYSYDFGFVEYPGERDFFERWLMLEKNQISLKGKVVVELGCNLGLFGSYSIMYGAKHAMCFDIDSDIINCAKELSDVMELKNIKHEVRDLDVKGTFKDISEIDFLFAMSVYFWLKDTTEFDRLMKLTKEVLYEGHEQYEVEYSRLKNWGFVDIKTVGITDRLRTIFYAKR